MIFCRSGHQVFEEFLYPHVITFGTTIEEYTVTFLPKIFLPQKNKIIHLHLFALSQ